MNDWAPTSGPDTAARRAELLQRARQYFASQDVMAVDTPALSPAAPTDPNIEPFSLQEPALHLHTSPEFAMKRLLAAGYPDIYSICRVFRAGELGRHHLAEFTMIEWYRRDMTLVEIIDDTLRVITKILDQDIAVRADAYDYIDLFASKLATNPLTATINELSTIADADADLRAAVGDDRDAWLDLIMTSKIAPDFPEDVPTIIKHYPASQAALARICPDDSQVADRFEIFWGNVELANGYVELTDATEQSQRMQHDLAQRRDRGLAARPHDNKLLAALDAGLPACAGVALGFERLHMIDARTDDIRNVVSFVE